MVRLRLRDLRTSLVPSALGFCEADQDKFVRTVNEAQERLMLAGGEVGWWGSWAKMVFNVDSTTDPFITLPREVARLINIDYCRRPIPVQNEFYEFLEAGIGLQSETTCPKNCQLPQGYDRGLFPTFRDLTPPNKRLRFYITEDADIGKRILTQGEDSAGQTIRTMDGLVQVQGIYSTLSSPFVDTPLDISLITGLQKDVTIGNVAVYMVDTVTAEQTLLLTMEPSEQVSGYRRYFLAGLPKNCCNPAADTTTVQVTAMAKLELIPVKVDSDYLLIQSIAAMKEECLAVRQSEIDDPSSLQKGRIRHLNAIRLLNGQLVHLLGKDMPAVNFAPFGTAKLSRQLIGQLT